MWKTINNNAWFQDLICSPILEVTLLNAADSCVYTKFDDADLVERLMSYLSVLEVKRRLKPLIHKRIIGGGPRVRLTTKNDNFILIFQRNTLLYNNRLFLTKLNTKHISDEIKEIYDISVERHGERTRI